MRLFTRVCFFLLCVNLTQAHALNNTPPKFDLNVANEAFDRINLQLSVQNLNADHLNSAIDKLSGFMAQADRCVNTAQKRLASIDAFMQQGIKSVDKSTTGADSLYLDAEHKKKAARLAECRLFSIRAKEAIDAYKTAIAQLKGEETLVRELSLGEIIDELRQSSPQRLLTGLPSIQIPLALQSYTHLGILGGIAASLSFMLMSFIRKSRFGRHYLYIKRLHTHQGLLGYASLMTLCLMTGTVFTYLMFLQQPSKPPNLLLNLSQLLFFYVSSLLLIALLFHIKHIRVLFYWYSLDYYFFQSWFMFLSTFYALSAIGLCLLGTLDPNNVYWQLSQTLFLLTMLATTLYFVYSFCHAHRHLHIIKHHHLLIQRLGALILISCAVVTLLGYHPLAIRLTYSGLMTLTIIFVTLLILQSINKLYFILNHHQPLKTKIIKYFGYKDDQAFMEFLILKTTIQVIVIAISVFLIVSDWEFAIYYIGGAYTQILYGVHFGNVTIYPTRIVLGLVAYCLLYLLFRSISTAISRHQQFEDEEETQVAIASIFTYLGFGIALISALLIAGFNFTGLAIVAGALSVGIGLGLQSIVNNFVSGLILLIEKPIKPGDRINIDGVEGFVKKIRVRSTHIITPANEDVIVPNSDLITHRVTNYVYSNKQLSIVCEICVPKSSPAHLVRDLLLLAANNHEDVIKSARSKPCVIFRASGETTLTFQLCCLIKDVNKKSHVLSELNFAINQLLRDYSI